MDPSQPIPPARDDDDEDVYLALSTAQALWKQGEHAEALKRLRRAAELASDADADARSLELFKAAADLKAQLGAAAASVPPPAPPPPAPPAPSSQAPVASSPPAQPPQALPPPRRPPPSIPPKPPPRPSVPAPPMAHPAPAAAAPPAPPRPPSIPAPPPRPPIPVRAPAQAPQPAAIPSPPVPRMNDLLPAQSRRDPPPPSPQIPPKQPSTQPTRAPAPAPRAAPINGPSSPAQQAAPPQAAPSSPGAKVGAPRATGRRPTLSGGRKRSRSMVEGDPRAAQARPAAKQKPATYDDLDEDTRVLSRKQTSFEIDRGFEELSAATPEMLDESSTMEGPEGGPPKPPRAALAAGERGDEPTDRAPKVVIDAKAALSVTASHPIGWKVPDAAFPDGQTRTDLRAPVLEIPPARPSATATAPKRAETSVAVRVALLATGTTGDVRVIAVEPGVAPPEGSLVAWLVPSGGEAEAVLRLLAVERSEPGR